MAQVICMCILHNSRECKNDLCQPQVSVSQLNQAKAAEKISILLLAHKFFLEVIGTVEKV